MGEYNHHNPKVSIIVLTCNGKRFLFDCFTSIEKTEYADFETILIDNGSDDGSGVYVKENFPWVKVYYLHQNRGFTGGNNFGAGMAQGEYIIFVNDDVMVDPRWISELIKIAKSDPNIAAVSGYDIPMKFSRSKIDISKILSTKECAIACGCVWLIRKSAWEKIGPLREEFFCTWEEYEWSWRAFLSGYKIYSSPYSFVFHYGSGTSGIVALLSSKIRKDWDTTNFFYFYRNEFLFYWYTLSLPFLIWPVSKWILKFIYYGICRWNLYAMKHMGNAWLNLFRNRSKIWRERKTALAKWVLPDRTLMKVWKNQRNDWKRLGKYYESFEHKQGKAF